MNMFAILMGLAGIAGTPIVVKTSGVDSAIGTSQRPVASLARALQIAREDASRREIVVHAGLYTQLETIRIGPDLAGLRVRGVGSPILSGGIALRFLRETDDEWVFEAPPGPEPRELWVNGERRSRPRLPRQGSFRVEARVEPSPDQVGESAFVSQPGVFDKIPSDLGRVEVAAFHVWTMSRMRVASYDLETRIVRLEGSTGFPDSWASFARDEGSRFVLDNVVSAFGEPGEWIADPRAGVVRVKKLAGEERPEAIASRLENLLTVEGDDVRFSDLRLEHTASALGPKGRFFPQADLDAPSAVFVRNATGFQLVNCEVSHVGGYAIELEGGVHDAKIDRCEMIDLGAGGVRIGTTDLREGAAHTEGVTVSRCKILNGGKSYPAAVGVWIGHASNNRVLDNEIGGLLYTGVSVGWSWGYGPSGAHHNLIEGNHIHDIGLGVLSDMGGVYLLGLAPGTAVRRNFIHDVDSHGYGGWGLYTDEGSTGVTLERNVAFRTKHAGFHQHYGQDNFVRHNVFAFGREAQLQRTRVEPHRSFTLEENLFLFDGPTLMGQWDDEGFIARRNMYQYLGGEPKFGGKTWAQWRAAGRDEGSMLGEIGFMNPEEGDFRIREGSPALQFGFSAMDPQMKCPPPSPVDPPAFPAS